MKLTTRDTCRAMRRDPVDDYSPQLRRRMRNLRFLEETRSGRHPGGRGFPPYVSGCPDNTPVGAAAVLAAAVAAMEAEDHRRDSATAMPGWRESTIAETALARYGTTCGADDWP